MSRKVCPICNTENEETASICSHCGAWLEGNPTKLVAESESLKNETTPLGSPAESIVDIKSIPENGVGIHVAGSFKPLYVHVYKELIFGRATDATLEAVLDLSEQNASTMGVSRRHAMLRRTQTGFEVIDLTSRNGTWLNAEKLVPNRPYPLKSGSQLRLGQLRLLVVYHPVLKDTHES